MAVRAMLGASMYRHLLVPVDDSVLSDANAEAAVRLAGQLGSRVTFYRACADAGASRSGARLKASDPVAFAESTFGDSNAMLARHAVLAEDAGVAYELVSELNDHPAEAIVGAAVAWGCDLIVMATHGAHGVAALWHPSTTAAVLRHSPVPLLVTRIAVNDPVQAQEAVLLALHEEHQSISAVASAMKEMVEKAATRPETLDPLALESMLHYLQVFPLKVHHPKEELILHRFLLARLPEVAGRVNEIEAQHAREHVLVSRALALLEPVMSEAGAPSDELFAAILELCAAVRAHLALEDQVILPMAVQHLSADDWDSMAPVMHSHSFPGFGAVPAEQTRHLFTRIAELKRARAALPKVATGI